LDLGPRLDIGFNWIIIIILYIIIQYFIIKLKNKNKCFF
jgi:hypothetical protein